MNIVQFWIVDTIVKVTPKAPTQNTTTSQNGVTSDHDRRNDDERSPLLPK